MIGSKGSLVRGSSASASKMSGAGILLYVKLIMETLVSY